MACKACGQTEAQTEFYASVNSYCKEHWKERVRLYRKSRLSEARAYDRERANLPHRVEARKAYDKTERGKKAVLKAKRKYIERNPLKRKAAVIFNNAKRYGKALPMPCIICGENADEAHHFDYSKPLDVIWLCELHHKEIHKAIRELTRDGSPF